MSTAQSVVSRAGGWHYQWQGAPWNFVTGCEEHSPGCFLCYARSDAVACKRRAIGFQRKRLASGKPGLTTIGYQKDGKQTKFGVLPGSPSPGFGFDLRPDKLSKVPTGGPTRRVFVNSMSDLFNGQVPLQYIRDFCSAVLTRPGTTFMCQTKRPHIAAKQLAQALNGTSAPANVWVGATVENADPHVLARIPYLQDMKRKGHAAHVYVSFEPLVGLLPDGLDLAGIDWAYIGGESPQPIGTNPVAKQNCMNAGCHFTSKGEAYRPMNPDWARRVRDLLLKHEIPFLFKQWGAPSVNPNPKTDPSFPGDPRGGCQLDGQLYDSCP